jgi:aryl-alcohol dehydrogenase-like predicted oxidoreductase
MKREHTRDKRRLGTSDMFVSPVGLGCVQFSGRKGLSGLLWPPLSAHRIREIVRVSVEGGINWFDTAELYGWGESEKALSRALGELKIPRTSVALATKWWPALRRAGSIGKTIDDRLRHLDTEYIDLHQIHNPFSLSTVGSQMREMAKLAGSGKVRYAGVSNFSADRMRKAYLELSRLGLSLVSNQVNYSLLRREIESNGVMEAAKDLGVTIIAYSPLARGLLTGKFHDRPETIRERNFFRRFYGSLNETNLEKSRPVAEALKSVAEKYGATPSQVALNWLMNFHGESVVVIPGATSPDQAGDNAGAMDFKLSDDDLAYLDEVSAKFRHRY